MKHKKASEGFPHLSSQLQKHSPKLVLESEPEDPWWECQWPALASGLTTCPWTPEPTRMGPAPLPPRGPFLPASQRCSWIAPATPGAELGQAPTCANLQSGMPELARGAACLGPWAILKEPEGLRGPGVSAPSWGQMPGRFCALHTCSGRSALKVYTESLSPTVGE